MGEPTSDQVPVDAGVLEKMRLLGGEVLVLRLLRLYLELSPQRVQAGRAALAGGDREVAERSFHSMRSSSANVGAHELSRLSGLLENRIHRGDLEVSDALQAVEAELARVLPVLEAEVRRLEEGAS